MFFSLFILQEANSVLHSTSSSLLIDIQAMYVCAWSQNLGIIFDTIFFKNSVFSLLCGFVNNFHQARPTSFTQNNANISVHSQRLNSFISQWTGSYLHQLILCLHINNQKCFHKVVHINKVCSLQLMQNLYIVLQTSQYMVRKSIFVMTLQSGITVSLPI